MSGSIRFKLSLMMFLEFFIWGAWFVTLGTFLGNNLNATGAETSNIFGTQSWGAILSPFIIGLIADRFFNAERILGVLHLVGAGLMYLMYTSGSAGEFFPYVLGYMILFMPTLALVNSISFRQLSDPEKQFSGIRIWGTIGWILAGLAISYVFKWDSASGITDGMLRNTFLMASVVSVVLAVFSFFLPKTPPTKSGSSEKSSISEILGLDALKLLKDKNFLVFFISSILICIPLAFYYQNANPFLAEVGMENPTGKMTIGQASEVLFLLALPVFFKRFGFKMTILLAMAAWGLRYLLFAYGDASGTGFMLLLGIALHGICYDFFFVAGQIYTDAKAGEKYKSAAQGLISLATYGVGMLIGFWAAGLIGDNYIAIKESGNIAEFWYNVWIIPAGIAFAVMVLFFLFFKNEKVEAK
jgi:nucleoside transporter